MYFDFQVSSPSIKVGNPLFFKKRCQIESELIQLNCKRTYQKATIQPTRY